MKYFRRMFFGEIKFKKEISAKSIQTQTFLLFFLFAVVFSLLRIGTILTAIERISHYDELDLGMIAKEWIGGGAKLPLWHYQMDAYGGESIILSALCIPFIKFLGPTLLAVKLPSFLFVLLTFCLMFFFINRYFGWKKASAFSLLFIFCPPAFVQFTLAGLSGHSEALLFSVGMLWSIYDFLYGSRKPLSLFLFGFLGGVGFWFYHENILMILTGLLCWRILDRGSMYGRLFLFFLAGLGIGLIPWLSYNSYYHYKGIHFIFESLLPLGNAGSLEFYNDFLRKAARLILRGIPFSFACFSVMGIHKRIFSVIYCVLFYLPLLPFFLKQTFRIFRTQKDEEKILPFLLFPFVFMTVFLLSPFDIAYTIGYIGFRYMAPLQFFWFCLIAISRLKMKKILLSVLIFMGVLGQSSLLFQTPFGDAQRYKGYSYYQVGTQWRFSLAPLVKTQQDFFEIISRFSSQEVFFLLWGVSDLGVFESDELLLANTSIPLDESLHRMPQFSYPYLYEWRGSLMSNLGEVDKFAAELAPDQKLFVYKGFFENWGGLVSELLKCPQCFDKYGAAADWAYISLGKYFYFEFDDHRYANFYIFHGDPKESAVRETVDRIHSLNFAPTKRDLIYKGIGMAHYWTSSAANRIFNQSFKMFLDKLPPEDQKSLFWGLGWTVRRMYREDRHRALEKINNSFPVDGKKQALEGLKAFEKWYGFPEEKDAWCVELESFLLKEVSLEESNLLKSGNP